MVVVFDMVETLFSLGRVGEVFRTHGASDQTVELWFARLLQSAMAATLDGRYLAFADAAESTLRQISTTTGFPEDAGDSALQALRELDPYEDAANCLASLHSGGHRLAALTNSGSEAAKSLMRRSGLDDFFEMLLSTDQARACKLHPRPYEMALQQMNTTPRETYMVAAHGWDILGADAVGLRTIWVSRREQRWPFLGNPPGATIATLAEVPPLVARTSMYS